MKKGSHIKVRRIGYDHHGIYIGNDEVIHYTGEPGHKAGASVKLTSLEEFLDGGTPKVVRHEKCLPPDEVVERAMSRLGENEYNLIFNNCEHFASWCKAGDKKSEQVRKSTNIAGNAIAIEVARKIAAKPDTLTKAASTVAAISKAGTTGLADAGLTSGLAAIGGIVGGGMAADAGLTSGLAAIGGTVGGGMVGGTVMAAAAPAVATLAAGVGVYKLLKWLAD